MPLALHWIGLPVVGMVGYPVVWSSGIDRNTRDVAVSYGSSSGGDGGSAWFHRERRLLVTG